MVPAQPPSGMSGKSGSVVPGLTLTAASAANRAGAETFFCCGFFFATGTSSVLPATCLRHRLSFGAVSAISVSATDSADSPQNQGEGQAQEQAGHDREVEAEVLPLDADVAGHPAQPGGGRRKEEDQPDPCDNQAEAREHPADGCVIVHGSASFRPGNPSSI